MAVEPDWRLVDEEELHVIYGDEFVDDARTSPAVARGPGVVRSADMSMLRRRKLVEHFNITTLFSARGTMYTRSCAQWWGRVGRKSDRPMHRAVLVMRMILCSR